MIRRADGGVRRGPRCLRVLSVAAAAALVLVGHAEAGKGSPPGPGEPSASAGQEIEKKGGRVTRARKKASARRAARRRSRLRARMRARQARRRGVVALMPGAAIDLDRDLHPAADEPEIEPTAASSPEPGPGGAAAVAASSVAALDASEASAAAEDDAFSFGGDDAFSFGGEVEGKAIAIDPASPYSAGGSLRSTTAAWIKEGGERTGRLAQARDSIDLWARRKTDRLTLHASGHAEVDLAYQVDRGSHAAAMRDTYGHVLEPREVYAEASVRSLDLTVGRFVSAWGEGLMLTPLDVVNPRDQREVGLVEPDELRLPTLGTRVALSGSIHELELIVMHESTFGRRAPPGGDYSALPSLFPLLEVRESRWVDAQPRFSLETQQVFGRWSVRAHQVDAALYAARSLDQQGVVIVPPIDPASSDVIDLVVDHRAMTTLGVSGALTVGDLVFKLETAVQPFRPLNLVDPATEAVSARRFMTATGMVGINYWKAPWRSTLEISKMQVQEASIGSSSMGGPPPLLVASTDAVVAARVQYLPELGRFQATAAGVAIGEGLDAAWLGRLEGGLKLGESLLVVVGVATYHPSRDFNVLAGLDDVDRVYARLRWDFGWD